MTALYVPPTEETDPKKQNQSLQLIGGVTATNTTNIATNTTDIATNAAAITALQGNRIGRVIKQAFTATGNYTPTAGMLYCIIECVGGGGGGGATSSAGTGTTYGAGGGGSGGYSRSIKTLAQIQADGSFASGHITITIGAGGAGGSAGTNNGAAGGDTSAGSLVIGKGGAGGLYASAGQIGAGGAAGVAGTGDLAAAGMPGFPGIWASSFGTVILPAGNGGNSFFGGGAQAGGLTSGATTAGTNAGNYGSGGSGGASANVASNAAGGNGSSGVVFITEFCIA